MQTLAAHLTALVSDPERLAARRAEADAQRQAFTWSRVADQLEDVYGRLVGATA